MSVVRLDIAYDGTDFHGWARQPRVRTVEGVLTEALGRLLGEEPKLSVAGRTDAGVHAEGQVASFTAPGDIDLERARRALNRMLGPEIAIRRARRAPEGFDARFSASGREYRYDIETSDTPDPFAARFVWHRPGALAVPAMRAAARSLIGEHDFASFCRAADPPASTVRNLRTLSVNVRGTRVGVRAQADAFLHQMVRSLVGTLVRVGEGRLDPAGVAAILAARDRAGAGTIAPAQGLSLLRVRYAK